MDEYIKQNASGLYLEIQKIGCFFRSALFMAEYKTGKKLNVEQINKLWSIAQRFGYIDEENNVKNSAGIANLALHELKSLGHFQEIATKFLGEPNFYSSVQKRRIDICITKMKQNGPSKTHFIVEDPDGALLFEPHDPPIINRGTIYTICYRYDE